MKYLKYLVPTTYYGVCGVLLLVPSVAFLSFIQAISILRASSSPLQVHYYSEAHLTHHGDTVPEFLAEAPQATASEGLAQGPYVAARSRLDQSVTHAPLRAIHL